MKKKLVCLSVGVLFAFNAYTQDTICSTPSLSDSLRASMPWYGNNAYLYELLDSLGYSLPTSQSNKRIKPYDIPTARFRVPLHFWFYDKNNQHLANNPSSYLPEAVIQKQLDRINHIYSAGQYNKFGKQSFKTGSSQTGTDDPTYDLIGQNHHNSGILFYMDCDYHFFDNSDKETVSSKKQARQLANDNFAYRRLNVHLLWVYDPSNGTHFNRGASSFVIADWEDMYRSRTRTTLAHELGHAFGLAHPHQHSAKSNHCKREPVSRTRTFGYFTHSCFSTSTRCHVSGDDLCDTHASPKLHLGTSAIYHYDRFATPFECYYNDYTATDLYGDYYYTIPPQVENLMGYGNCRRNFTWGQIGVMAHWAVKKRGLTVFGTTDSNPAIYFDRFEPDNTKTMARPYRLNDLQHHSFHWVGTEPRLDLSDCDQDWVKFRIENVPQTVRIATDVGHINPADTYLDLFKSDGTWIAADDNGNGNGFSLLDNQTLQPGEYYLQITKLNANPTDDVRDYVLDISECFPETLCVSGWIGSGEVKRYATRGELTVPCPNQTLIVAPGGELQLRSQTRVVMKPGFRAEDGAVFRAKIEPAANLTCDDNSSFYEIDHGSNKRGPDPFARAKYDYRTFPGKEAYQAQLSEAYGPGEPPDSEDFPDYAYEAAQLGRRPPTEAQIEVFPNPFRSEVSLRLSLPDEEKVSLEVYSIVGKKVTQLMNRETVSRGYHERTYDLSDLPGGAYMCKVWIGGDFQTFKLMKN